MTKRSLPIPCPLCGLKNRFRETLGLELHRKRPPAPFQAAIPAVALHWYDLVFRPATVIHVGMAYEIDERYPRFKGANFLLIEPLVESSCYRAQYVRSVSMVP